MPTALRPPPALEPPHRVASDHVARRLADVYADPPGPFPVHPVPGLSPAAALAVHCPDLFLVASPADRRTAVVAELTAAAVRGGQRVLVVAADAGEVFAAVSDRCGGEVGRAVGPGETLSPTCRCVPHTAHARGVRFREAERVGLRDRAAELAARICTEERRERWQADAAALSADLDRVADSAAAVVEQSDGWKQLAADYAAGVAAVEAHAALRSQLEREVAAFADAAAHPPAGFLKRLFGGGKPDPATLESAQAKLRELSATAPPDPHPAYAAARERLVADATAARRAELERRLAAVRADLAALPPAEPLEELGRAYNAAAADLARLDSAPPSLPAAEMDAVRVVVGPPDAVGHDPFLSGTHPELEPRFDRVVWADGEDLSDDTFPPAARLGAAWVVVGTPDPLHPPGYRNGRPRAAFFSRWWERLHAAAWTYEGGRPLARLLAVASRSELACEPLHGRADIEVRWADRDGTPALAEVLFPAGMPAAEAKAFLAREADEVRFGGFGECEWDSAGGAIRCRWPAVEAAGGVVEEIDLGNGVRERTVNGSTASVTFAGDWTRDTANLWLAERLLPCPRTAVV